MPMDAPAAVPLYAYQHRWLADKGRFKVGKWSRQVGKTFVCTLEIVLDMLRARAAGQASPWLIMSRGDRQAREAMRVGIQTHARAIGAALRFRNYDLELEGQRFNVDEWDAGGGNVVTAVPANPATARGFRRNVFLDEFAHHLKSREIWGALFPVVSRGMQLRIASTPNGKQGQFYELMTSDEATMWSRHEVDIYKAVAEGCPMNIEELRAGLADDELFAQEYECQWLDQALAWLPYDLIDACESAQAGQPELYDGGLTYIGNDIGRHKHLWVAWAAEQVGDVLMTREIRTLKGRPFREQDEALDQMLDRYRLARLAIDATGIGEKPAEDAATRHGTARVEGVKFNPTTKLNMATALKERFEDRKIRIPQGDRVLRADLHSVRRVAGATGHVRLLADDTDDGHADRFWAAALMAGAAAEGRPEYGYTTGRAGVGARASRRLERGAY